MNSETHVYDGMEYRYDYPPENPVTKPVLWNFFRVIVDMIPRDVRAVREVGCGPGYSAKEILGRRQFDRYVVSDIHLELAEWAKKRNPKITEARAESLYSLSETDTDITLCLEVLEHVSDPSAAIKELSRTAKRVLVSVPNEPLWRILNMLRGSYWNDWGNSLGHINHWSTKEFIKLCSPHFVVKECRTPIPWTILLLERK